MWEADLHDVVAVAQYSQHGDLRPHEDNRERQTPCQLELDLHRQGSHQF